MMRTGLFTYSALAKGGTLLWYLVPTSPANLLRWTKYQLHHQNVPYPPNKHLNIYKYVYIAIKSELSCRILRVSDVCIYLIRNVDI